MIQADDSTLAAQIEALALYKLAGEAIDHAWNRSNACTAQSLPPIDLADNEKVFLGKAAVDAALPAIVAALGQGEAAPGVVEEIAELLEPWAWDTSSYNATVARDDARAKAQQIVDAIARQHGAREDAHAPIRTSDPTAFAASDKTKPKSEKVRVPAAPATDVGEK